MNERFSSEKYTVIQSLEKAGLDERQAGIVADCLVTADEWGVTSHGVRILPSHLDRLCRGAYNTKPTFHILKETPTLAIVHIPHDPSVSQWVTVSVGGITVAPPAEGDYAFYLQFADTMLYDAKRSGRNRVVWADEQLRRMLEK